MEFDPCRYGYPSRRNVVFARNVVATSNPLAAQAGLAVMQRGGNAVDAAVATAAALTVVEPTSNGIGGDAFAIVSAGGSLYGLNASGYAPSGIDADALIKQGIKEVPAHSWAAVTVPGATSAWAALSARFGTLPLTQTLKPAIDYARHGYPLTVDVGKGWRRAYEIFTKASATEGGEGGGRFKPWFDTFAPDGWSPAPGALWRSDDMADTLELLADTCCEDFYRGGIARDIAAFARSTGGYMDESDLGDYYPEWVAPISVSYRGFDVHELPPNGQGLVALLALNLLKGFQLDARRESDKNYHLQIESMKLAFADAEAYIADRRYMDIGADGFLSESYADTRRSLLGERAAIYGAGTPRRGGTVYLATADAQGNMVSYIQSNYMGFGSGLVVPRRAIALHNRGCNFRLEAGHPNCIAPRKKPYHTIIPGFLSRDGAHIGPFGVMGGFMQPQAHLQVISSAIDFQLNPQEILDAPRWQWQRGKAVLLDECAGDELAQRLVERGHEVTIQRGYTGMGRGQVIWRMPNGVYCAGTEPRSDGAVACF